MSPECLNLRHSGDVSHISVISVNDLSELPEIQAGLRHSGDVSHISVISVNDLSELHEKV